MTFTRYEIRWIYHRCFYEGGDKMEYVPFDTLKQAREYARSKKDLCKSDSDCECGIYKVVLHSDYDEPTLVERL